MVNGIQNTPTNLSVDLSVSYLSTESTQTDHRPQTTDFREESVGKMQNNFGNNKINNENDWNSFFTVDGDPDLPESVLVPSTSYVNTFSDPEFDAQTEEFLDEVQSSIGLEDFKRFLKYFVALNDSNFIIAADVEPLITPLWAEKPHLFEAFKRILTRPDSKEYQVKYSQVDADQIYLIYQSNSESIYPSNQDTDPFYPSLPSNAEPFNQSTPVILHQSKAESFDQSNADPVDQSNADPSDQSNTDPIDPSEIHTNIRETETRGEDSNNRGNSVLVKSLKTRKPRKRRRNLKNEGRSEGSCNLNIIAKRQKTNNEKESVLKIKEISTSACPHIGKSYYVLPLNHVEPKCSGRTELCNEVLNDTYKCIPSAQWDKKISNVNKNERIMMEVEDERYELDMVIDGNDHTINHLNSIRKRMMDESPKDLSSSCLGVTDEDNRLDRNFSTSLVLHQISVQRIYGNKATSIMKGLRKRPEFAIPIVLTRLKIKNQEWCEARKELNKIWRSKVENANPNDDACRLRPEIETITLDTDTEGETSF